MIWSILTGVLAAVTICLVAELRKRDNQIYNLKQAEKYSRFKENEVSNSCARLEKSCEHWRAQYNEARDRWNYWSLNYDKVNKELSGLLVTVESLHRMRDQQNIKITKLKEQSSYWKERYQNDRKIHELYVQALCGDPKKYRIARENGDVKLYTYYGDGISACVKALKDTDKNFTEMEYLQGALGREEDV
jgi:hypothetical protein